MKTRVKQCCRRGGRTPLSVALRSLGIPFLLFALWTTPGYSSVNESKFPAGSNAKDRDFFGSKVAISGDWAVVGAPGEPGYSGDAKVYFYKRTPSGWIEQAKFVPLDQETDVVHFAESVAISGTYAIVGASAYDGYGKSKAFIYHYDGSNWTMDQIIEPSNNFGVVFDNRFGQSVAISGDHAIVGATDRAYIFKRDMTGWIEQTPFLTSGNHPSRGFGYAVAISGNYAIVGGNDVLAPVATPAKTHIFFFDGATWTSQATLSPGNGLKAGTRQAVSISADYAVIGHTTANFANSYEGEAYLFVRNGTQWAALTDLKSTPGPNTRFGWSVSIGSEMAVVGDPWDTNGGSTYFFGFSGNLLAKINSGDAVDNDRFGQSVAIDGATIVVAAPFKAGPAGVYQGAVYGYTYWAPPFVLTHLFDMYSLCRRCPQVCLTCPPVEMGPEAVILEELAALPPTHREFVLGLRLSQMAPLIADQKVSREIQQVGLGMMKKAMEATRTR